MKLNTYQALFVSIAIPSVITFLGVQSSYWFNVRANLGVVETAYFLLAVIVGGYAFHQVKIASKPKLVIAWIIYAFILVNIIFWIGLFAACSNGDCL